MTRRGGNMLLPLTTVAGASLHALRVSHLDFQFAHQMIGRGLACAYASCPSCNNDPHSRWWKSTMFPPQGFAGLKI